MLMPVYADVTELVGRTPLVELARFGAHLPVRLLAKLESANPGVASRTASRSP